MCLLVAEDVPMCSENLLVNIMCYFVIREFVCVCGALRDG